MPLLRIAPSTAIPSASSANRNGSFRCHHDSHQLSSLGSGCRNGVPADDSFFDGFTTSDARLCRAVAPMAHFATVAASNGAPTTARDNSLENSHMSLRKSKKVEELLATCETRPHVPDARPPSRGRVSFLLRNGCFDCVSVHLLHMLHGKVACGFMALLLLLLLLSWTVVCMHLQTATALSAPGLATVMQYPPPAGLHSLPESVLVHHSSAARSLSTYMATAPHLFPHEVDAIAHHLPSWTLHVLSRNCSGCTEEAYYAAALRQAALSAASPPPAEGRYAAENARNTSRYAVFATRAAPMGVMGPMLLAMSSITNDLELCNELPKWEWTRQTFQALAQQPRSAYLAVMGITSADQTHRAALRSVHRSSWHTYADVARAANHFDGALLPLYILAAGDLRAVHTADVRHIPIAGHAVERGANTTVEAVLPTTEEFISASACHDLVDSRVAGGPCWYVKRRVALRHQWTRTSEDESPCADVVTTRTVPTASRDWTDARLAEELSPSTLAMAAEYLSLPVTPAFAAPAHFICHASSAAWKEALEHRDVVWLDMLTDVRPRVGDAGILGRRQRRSHAAQIGLVQKSLLWLHYAYNAFPGVRFIVKGDDDVYLKVPQYLRDLRHLGSELVESAIPSPDCPSPPSQQDRLTGQSISSFGDAPTVRLCSRRREDECLFIGKMVPHVAKMLLEDEMLHTLDRRLVRAITDRPAPPLQELTAAGANPTDKKTSATGTDCVTCHGRVDYMQLLTHPQRVEICCLYANVPLQHEGMMIRFLLQQHEQRVAALCPRHRARPVAEGPAKYVELHKSSLLHGVNRRASAGVVSWSAVAVHRCLAADFPYLHFFFGSEHAAVTATAAAEGRGNNEAARFTTAALWAKNNVDPSLPGFGNWPRTEYGLRQHDVLGSPEEDKKLVWVYNTTYVLPGNAKDGAEHAYRSYPYELPVRNRK